jgi:hypothetical protein
LILPESATDNTTINHHTLNNNEEQNPGFKKYLMEKHAKDDLGKLYITSKSFLLTLVIIRKTKCYKPLRSPYIG